MRAADFAMCNDLNPFITSEPLLLGPTCRMVRDLPSTERFIFTAHTSPIGRGGDGVGQFDSGFGDSLQVGSK